MSRCLGGVALTQQLRLHQLTEKYDLSDATFLVDGYVYLTAVLRLRLINRLDYTDRNHVENCAVSSS